MTNQERLDLVSGRSIWKKKEAKEYFNWTSFSAQKYFRQLPSHIDVLNANELFADDLFALVGTSAEKEMKRLRFGLYGDEEKQQSENNNEKL